MFQNMTTQWQQKKQAFQQREEQKLANDTAALQVFQQIEVYILFLYPSVHKIFHRKFTQMFF
jgi:hypothetical protein